MNKKEYQKKWKKENKGKVNKNTKDYRERNKEKFKKRDVVKNLTKNVIINLWEKEQGCFMCNTKNNLVIHHWTYRKPIKRCDFSVVCKKCHKNIHSVGYQHEFKKTSKRGKRMW